MKHRYLKNVTTLDYDSAKCAGCGRCAEVCPHGVFVMDEKIASIADRDSCMECGACAINCPADAIAVDAGVGCAAAIIIGWFTGSEPSCDCSGGNKKSACCG